MSKLCVLLDEGVPLQVGRVFENAGHSTIYFSNALKSGSPDALVAKTALVNDAALVVFDRDMGRFMKRGLAADDRFARLNLLRFECSEPMAAARLKESLSLIEHEWQISQSKRARQFHVSIGKHIIRTHR